MRRPGIYVGFFLVQASRGDICFNAQNWFYSGRFGFFVKLYGAVHVAVVGKGQSGHVVFFCFINQLAYFCQPIEKGVMGMSVQVNERHKIKRVDNNYVIFYKIFAVHTH